MHLFGCLTFTAVLLATAWAQGIQGTSNNLVNTANNAITFANSANGGLTSSLDVSNLGAGTIKTGVVGTGGFNAGSFNTGILGASTVGTAGNFGVASSVAGTPFQALPNSQAWNLVDDNMWNIPATSLPLTTQNAVTFGMPQMIGSSAIVSPPLTQLNNILSSQGIGTTALNMPVSTLNPSEQAYNMQVPLYNSFSNVNTFSTPNPGLIVQDAAPVYSTGLFQYPTLFGSNFDMDMDLDLGMNSLPLFQAPASGGTQNVVLCTPVTQ